MQAIGALALLVLSACATHAPATHGAGTMPLGARVLDGYIRPATRDLHAAVAGLQQGVAAYCSRPDPATRRAVEQRFAAAVAAWARVEPLRFGPLVEENRLEHFFFWPDPRGVTQRQVRTLIGAADRAVLEEAAFVQQSAAVQGLPALELALYAEDAPGLIAAGSAAGRYRCDFAMAIAANLLRLATGIEAGWRDGAPLAREFARPDADGAVYRSSGEVATETLKTLSTALHAMRDQKLVPALGKDIGEARGTLLPLHRSGLTTRYLAAGVAALEDFYAASRLGQSLPPDSAWVDASFRDELRRMREDLDELRLPAAAAVADAGQRDLLVHLSLLLTNARSIVDEYLVPALGVNLGFNSLDGD